MLSKMCILYCLLFKTFIIMVRVSVGQISILLFCMEYIFQITNLRFANPISYFIYNKVATATILKTKSTD